MAFRGLALALLLVAFSSGEIHDATENLPNAGAARHPLAR